MKRMIIFALCTIMPVTASASDFSSMAGWNALAGVLANSRSGLDLGMEIGGIIYTQIWHQISPILYFLFIVGLAASILGKSLGLHSEPSHIFYSLIFSLILGYPHAFTPSSPAGGFADLYLINAKGKGVAGAAPVVQVPTGLYYPYEAGSAILGVLINAVDTATTDGTDATGLPLALLGAVQSTYSSASQIRSAPGLQSAIFNYARECQNIATNETLVKQAALVGLQGGSQIGEANPLAIRQREAHASDAIQALKNVPLSGIKGVNAPPEDIVQYPIPNSRWWAQEMGMNPKHCRSVNHFLNSSPGMNISGMCLSQSASSPPLSPQAMKNNFLRVPPSKTADVMVLAPTTCFGLYQTVNLGLSQYQNAYSLKYAVAYGTQASWAQKYLPKPLLELYQTDKSVWKAIASSIPGMGGLVNTSRGVAALSTTKAYNSILQGSSPPVKSRMAQIFQWLGNDARSGMAGFWSKVTGLSGDYSMQTDVPLWMGTLSLGLALLVIAYPLFISFSVLPGRLGSLSLPYQLLAFILVADGLCYSSIKVGGVLAVLAIRIASNGTAAGNLNYIHEFAPIAAQIDVAIHALFLGACALAYLLVSRNWGVVASAGGALMSETRAWSATAATALGLAGGAAAITRTAAAASTAKEAKEVSKNMAALKGGESRGTPGGRDDGRAGLAAYMKRQGHAIKRDGNVELGDKLIKRGHQIANAVKKGTKAKGEDQADG